MSSALLYNFSDCSSPSPLPTPIARRGLSYHKLRAASANADTTSRQYLEDPNELLERKTASNPIPSSGANTENTRTTRVVSQPSAARLPVVASEPLSSRSSSNRLGKAPGIQEEAEGNFTRRQVLELHQKRRPSHASDNYSIPTGLDDRDDLRGEPDSAANNESGKDVLGVGQQNGNSSGRNLGKGAAQLSEKRKQQHKLRSLMRILALRYSKSKKRHTSEPSLKAGESIFDKDTYTFGHPPSSSLLAHTAQKCRSTLRHCTSIRPGFGRLQHEGYEPEAQSLWSTTSINTTEKYRHWTVLF